jgi:diguanylate cyclase (GGDEF)-like protein
VAKKVLFALSTVAAGVTLIFTVAFPTQQTRTEASLTVAGCLLILALATSMLLASRPSVWVWATYPFTAVAVIAVLDISSHDASVTAQIFFIFPMLYAGAQLKRLAAIAVCVAAAVADAVVTLLLLPLSTALVDSCFMAATLATATTLLMLSGERTDRLIAQLERQAAIDPLTGLLTRRVLDSAAASALVGAANDGGTALLLIDLDHFKQVNDVHGHPGGDMVLQQLASLLMGVNRSSDVISRMGGDEIAILLPGCALDSALRKAEQILLEIRTHTFDLTDCTMADADGAATFSLSASIGIAHVPTHAKDLRALYAAADASLYAAKRTGRDRVGATRPSVDHPQFVVEHQS